MRERFPRDLAIVGMACVFPKAPDLKTFWQNITEGVDAITDVPPSRWEPRFYDPDSDAPDRVYCKRGGFIDEHAHFDALRFGVMPIAAAGAEPDQLLALQVAADALGDAGYDKRPIPNGRTGVVIGRGGYLTPGMARLEQRVRTAEQVLESLRALIPGIGESELETVRRDFQSKLGSYGPDSAIGLVPNLTASRIANRLDLHGPAHTVDAACASALVAVEQACRDLADGRTDLALTGGVHVCHDISFWSVFSQLGALSRSEQIRPFDSRADGLLIGEGLGIIVLKRLADAERDGDRIYAVIRGCGIASDGREASLMNPRVDGQLLALRRAWRAAGLDPETLGLLEAHGTGTPTGDEAELATLGSFFGGPLEGARRIGLGSVKSMIGHAMPAAGIAGLIKAAMAVDQGILPPTLHCEEPNPRLLETRFRLITRAEPWEKSGVPRRAGVNAFGFGGINAHVILEAYGEGGMRHRRTSIRSGRPEAEADAEPLLILARETTEALLAALDQGSTERGSGPCRLALVDPTPERLARAHKVVSRGKPRRGRDGLWFSPRGLSTQGSRIAFLFPGVEAVFEPRVEDIAAHFGLPSPPRPDAGNLEQLGLAIVAVGRLLDEALRQLGIRPDLIAGHSIGEWSGMISTSMIPEDELETFLASLVPGSLEVPGVVFCAAGCGVEKAAAAIEDLEEIAVSHDNCPHQVILCGREDSIEAATRRLRGNGVLCQRLPFRSGFHSPLFEDYLGPHRAHLKQLDLQEAVVPLWSATSCAPYPPEPEAIRRLAIEHLVRPVRFRELIETLHERGVRIFLQIGTGSLVGFVEDTLRGRPHLAMSATVPQRSGMAQLRRLAAALFVEGLPVELARLQTDPTPTRGAPMRLDLGAPLVRLDHALTLTSRPSSVPAVVEQPLLSEFNAALQEATGAQRDVLAAWEKRRAVGTRRAQPAIQAPKERRTRRVFSVKHMPYLADHCLLPQREGWTNLADRHPVVPMTTSIAMMIDEARELAQDATVVGVEGIRAYRWLAVEPPTEVQIVSRREGAGRIKVSIEGYAEATILCAERYPEAPDAELVGEEEEFSAPTTADRLYLDRWMFHGPAFQGTVELGPLSKVGIRGTLEVGEAPGALLDNAGQLLGFWVMVQTDVDRLAMPIQIARMDIFGPEPRPGARVQCVVRIRHLGPKSVRGDIDIVSGNRVWARIQGWEDRRFEIDARLWAVLRHPDREILSETSSDGYCLVDDVWRSAPTRDFVARRYLGSAERAEYSRIGPRRQRAWLAGRIAAKDAVRHWLWRRGHPPIYPAEVQIHSDPSGRPGVSGVFDEDLRLSIAHKGDRAVAMVACGRDVGIDLERVEPRDPSFDRVAFTDQERSLLSEEEPDLRRARLWAAKEAAAKMHGTGLRGNPKAFVASGASSAKLAVNGAPVSTRVLGPFVVAWCVREDGDRGDDR